MTRDLPRTTARAMIAMNLIRLAAAVAATAAPGGLVTFTASGCSTTRTVAVTANGLENKTGTQVAQDAAAALEAAKSVHVKGVIVSPRYRFDVRIQGADSAGTETLPGGQAQLIIIRTSSTGYADTYLKAGPEVLKKLFGASAPIRILAGRWLKVPPALDAVLPGYGFSTSDFGTALVTFFSPAKRTVRQATVHGSKVVIVSYQDGSKLSVANTGPAYPQRWDDKGPGAGWTDFTEYGTNFRITAPGNAIHLTGQG